MNSVYADVLAWPVFFAGCFIFWAVGAMYADWRDSSPYMRARNNRRHLKYVAAREKAKEERRKAFFTPRKTGFFR